MPMKKSNNDILMSYKGAGGFDEPFSSISEVVSLSSVFKSTNFGSSICDTPEIHQSQN